MHRPRRLSTALLALGSLLLLPAPAIGQGPDLAAEALAHYRHGDWPAAAEAYGRLVESNPYQGRFWQNYGFALHQLKRYPEAIAAFTKSLEAGFQPDISRYNICCGYALLGDLEKSLDWLEAAYEDGFNGHDELLRTDSDLAEVRKHPRFNRITMLEAPEGLSLVEGRRHDLDVLDRRIRQVHFHPFRVMSPDDFERALDTLRRDAGDLSDLEFAFRVQGILAMLGDGHTGLRFHDMPMHEFPVKLYLLKEGLAIIYTAPEHTDLLGSRVLGFGDVAAEEAIARTIPYISRDNPMGIKSIAPIMLARAEGLRFLGLIGEANELPLRLEKPDGTEVEVTLAARPPGSTIEWVSARSQAPGPGPLSRRDLEDPWWFEHLPEHRAVFFRHNVIRDKPHETLAAFTERLFAFIDDHDVAHLIIDLRGNGGGNSFLNRPLLHALIRHERLNEPGGLYVLIGRHTFSAAQNLATDIEHHTNAIFVGEPTGSKPSFAGETDVVTLPYTKLRFSCSSRWHQHSWSNDYREWIAPDIVAEPTLADALANRDTALELIMARLAPAG